MLEQKVWLHSGGGTLHPNLYVFLVGPPATGKTNAVRAAKSYLLEIPDFHMAPTSMTPASMIDMMAESKRMIIRIPDPPLEYNSMMINADELGAFIHKYDNEMIAVLSAFYDPDPYGHNRRGKDIKIKIKRPQLNMLCGTTPDNLHSFLPDGAWGQGFTSRTIMIFSEDTTVRDDFSAVTGGLSQDLLTDLKHINDIVGEVKVTEDYRALVNAWRDGGEQPAPNHPKLLYYNARRKVNFYKLSMIAAIDRSDVLLLTREDFNTAMNWLVQAENEMPAIFKAGNSIDAKAMDEIFHYVIQMKSVPEHKLVNFARERVPAHGVMKVLEVMERSGMIRAAKLDPVTGNRIFEAVPIN